MDLRGRRPFVPRPMGGVDWKRPRARIFRNECSGGTVEAGAREFEHPSKPRPCLTPSDVEFFGCGFRSGTRWVLPRARAGEYNENAVTAMTC